MCYHQIPRLAQHLPHIAGDVIPAPVLARQQVDRPCVMAKRPECRPDPARIFTRHKHTHQAPVAASAAPVQEALTAQDLAQQTRVKDAVLAWSLAWRQKDLDAYLQAYAPGFDPGSNVSRSAWEEQRRSRILSKKQIHIELSQFKIRVSTANAKATATFVQRYESGTVVTVSRKTLELIEDKGRWLIVREFVSGA